MSTVFEGVTRYSCADLLTDKGVEWVNSLAARILDQRYPDQALWVPVSGGPANGEWNRLVNGNNYAVPTDEQSEDIFGLLARISEIWLLPDECWE